MVSFDNGEVDLESLRIVFFVHAEKSGLIECSDIGIWGVISDDDVVVATNGDVDVDATIDGTICVVGDVNKDCETCGVVISRVSVAQSFLNLRKKLKKWVKYTRLIFEIYQHFISNGDIISSLENRENQ